MHLPLKMLNFAIIDRQQSTQQISLEDLQYTPVSMVGDKAGKVTTL